MDWPNWRRTGFIVLALLALLSLPSFYEHAHWFMMGHVESMVVQGRWDLVLLNIGVFLVFLLPLSFRKKIEWKSMGIYTAFIVSLFIEMYGVPLTVYISSAAAISPGGAPPTQEIIFSFTFLGQSLSMTFWKIVGMIISLIGMIIVILGWITLYKNIKQKELVTNGVYRYSRHPQYLGIILIAVGWFIHWPSLLTLAMLPVLIYFYYKLTIDEEKEVMQSIDNPHLYQKYREKTPRFI
ncbi:isoprenylcysteine carboxylmethyltransferase family protein [Methanonatronarchaeum sp. AMET-Sl]|uniref:methyltransferase family protein n=1 Tax=Methanonatronarchaeum sp. AMET-Sl TaxID=3037654 RepID=UPI00244E0A7D|nr:isoprenylcysteine carboxylmethyltransferase family protein [Methanonatronarchaeum sp. AMET-Sl]WGI17476.1 isoprenylcysteine carboxylmethyltransferase family protein [Methanonatronarchaeum sp. AMET-Sl]